MQIDSDFRDLLQHRKSSKLKIILSIAGIVLLTAIAGWVALAHSNQTTNDAATTQEKSSKQTNQNQPSSSDNMSSEKTEEPSQSSTPTSSNSSSSTAPQSPSSPAGGTQPEAKPYDPSKCQPLNDTAVASKQTADQKKITYDTAFAARKGYGDYYSQYGNSIDAQREYNAQEALLSVLQKEWSDALTASNNAYAKYQECRATL